MAAIVAPFHCERCGAYEDEPAALRTVACALDRAAADGAKIRKLCRDCQDDLVAAVAQRN